MDSNKKTTEYHVTCIKCGKHDKISGKRFISELRSVNYVVSKLQIYCNHCHELKKRKNAIPMLAPKL